MTASQSVTARVYAVGGGRGHAVRGHAVQQLLLRSGIDTELRTRFYRPDVVVDQTNRGRILIVDTFPRGWRNELTPSLLDSYKGKVFLARYSTTTDWQYVRKHYDLVAYPYRGGWNEWPRPPLPGICIGMPLRSDPFAASQGSAAFVVLDPEGRCSHQLIDCFERIARGAGLDFQLRSATSQVTPSHKLLVVGAGYNTFYELISLDIDVRFLPVRKRHDDQLRRCQTHSGDLHCTSLTELALWISAPAAPRAVLPASARCGPQDMRNLLAGLLGNAFAHPPSRATGHRLKLMDSVTGL